ncbi:inositol monophosphatase family protein [Ornithinimicrobium panacihumi]|uniref:inositol monophosphatase family protein n=1 Tax=Ornithinimicrobium panacihumi TaxID=2008449 RepID=UPI003F8B4087
MPGAPTADGPDAERGGELRDLGQLALGLAVGAARLISQERPDSLGVARTKSTDLDVVTVMDTRSEEHLRARLAELRPDDGVLGEEGTGITGTSGLTWVLDPIDGTVNYLYDLPGYAVSVAVVEGDPTTPGAWRPMAGAVANPATHEVFHAHRGGGAWLSWFGTEAFPWAGRGPAGSGGPVPLHVTDVADLGETLLATGFAYDRGVRTGQAAVVADLLPRVRDIRRLGAAAVDLCHVAAGRVDAYYEDGCHVWDLAAGVLIVTEAGGVVTGLGAQDAPSEAMVVAGGAAAQELLRSEVERLRGAPGRTTTLG